MKNKLFLVFIISCFFMLKNSNLEKEYLDKLLLITNGSFENLSVTILLTGNNINESQITKLFNRLSFQLCYDLSYHKEESKNVIIININKLKNYDQYKSLKNLFLKYNGKYYDYAKVNGTYKIKISDANYLKVKDSIKQYLKSKSFKVFEFENDNMIYINNNWIVSNVENFNIAICKYNDGNYLYIGLPEIMMNY